MIWNTAIVPATDIGSRYHISCCQPPKHGLCTCTNSGNNSRVWEGCWKRWPAPLPTWASHVGLYHLLDWKQVLQVPPHCWGYQSQRPLLEEEITSVMFEETFTTCLVTTLVPHIHSGVDVPSLCGFLEIDYFFKLETAHTGQKPLIISKWITVRLRYPARTKGNIAQ